MNLVSILTKTSHPHAVFVRNDDTKPWIFLGRSYHIPPEVHLTPQELHASNVAVYLTSLELIWETCQTCARFQNAIFYSCSMISLNVKTQIAVNLQRSTYSYSLKIFVWQNRFDLQSML